MLVAMTTISAAHVTARDRVLVVLSCVLILEALDDSPASRPGKILPKGVAQTI